MHKNVSICEYTIPDKTKSLMARAAINMTPAPKRPPALDLMQSSKMELQNMAAAQIAQRRSSMHRPHYDIVSHKHLDPTHIDKYELHNSTAGSRVNPARSYVITEFAHRNDSHKFHTEFAAGIKNSPGQYSQKLGQFNHQAATYAGTKSIIRSTNFSP
jgi:hypothetical protein